MMKTPPLKVAKAVLLTTLPVSLSIFQASSSLAVASFRHDAVLIHTLNALATQLFV